MTVAIIGGGNFFNLMHGPVVSKMPAITRMTHFNADPLQAKKNAASWHFDEVYPDIDSLLKNETVDCAYVFTPAEVTSQYAVKFIELGIAVFLEKPVAEDPADLLKIKAAYRQNSTNHFIAFNRRFSPIISVVKEFMQSHSPVNHIAVDFYRHDTRLPNKYMGSAVHPIDTIRYLFGDIQDIHTVRSQTEYFDHGKISYTSIFVFDSGLSGSLTFNCRAGHISEGYTVLAENTTLIAELSGPYGTDWPKTVKILTDRGNTVIKDVDLGHDLPSEHHTPSFFNGVEQEHRYFIKCLQDGTRMSPGIEETIGTMKTAYAIRECHRGALSEFQKGLW